jgi:hypothetical protein
MSDEKADGFGGNEELGPANVNCLAGKRCPKCGSFGPLEVQVSMRVLLFDEGTDDADDGSVEFDDGSAAMCYACRYEGKLGDFDVR